MAHDRVMTLAALALALTLRTAGSGPAPPATPVLASSPAAMPLDTVPKTTTTDSIARVERRGNAAGELLRIIAPPGTPYAIVHRGKEGQSVPLHCAERCEGIYASSYKDPSVLLIEVAGRKILVNQDARRKETGPLRKPYVAPGDLPSAKIVVEQGLKRQAFATMVTEPYWRHGYAEPLPGKGSPFGIERLVEYVRGDRVVGSEWKTHGGVDIPAAMGAPVKAPLEGIVLLAGKDFYYDGSIVILGHGDGLYTSYLHLSRIDVRQGQVVRVGERLGLVGASGYGVTGPHLHWSAKYRDRLIDPHSLDVLK